MGQPSRMRTMWRRAWRTMRAGVCHRLQRSVLGSATASGPVQAEQLEPAHEGVGEADDGEPGPVGVDVDEREPVGAGVLESADVVFDVGVGAHVHVEGDGVAGGVGVVTPVAEQHRGEQGLLGAGVQRFAAHDQPGPGRPVGQIDEVGELGHRRAGTFLAVLADRWLPRRRRRRRCG